MSNAQLRALIQSIIWSTLVAALTEEPSLKQMAEILEKSQQMADMFIELGEATK